MGRSKAPSLPIKALSFCRPTELRGKGGGASHQRGEAITRAKRGWPVFRRPQGGCMVFAAKGGIRNGAEGAVPRQRSDTIYLPRARALNPSGRRQPVPDRTLGAQGQRPGGAINPRGEAASTFGNTGKHRPGPIPHPPKFQIPIHLKKEGKFYASKNSTQNH